MTIETWLSGFLFLFIFVLQIAMAAFGYILEPTPKHYESEAKLQKFNNNPKRFKISIVLALLEHVCVITLAIMLFIAFSPYNIILGIIVIIFRIGEGAMQVYIEKNYWRLLNIARQYSVTSGTEKDTLNDSYRTILKTKEFKFAFAMICWSIGTLAFSILLVTYEVVPPIIGWLGIVASIPIGVGNGIKLVNHKSMDWVTMAGMLAILFEVLIGGWLLFN